MTLVQAQACGAAASNAGFDVSLNKNSDNSWKVIVKTKSFNDLSINVADAAALAVSQGVSGKISLIEYT